VPTRAEIEERRERDAALADEDGPDVAVLPADAAG
jgi:hypothetical protein